MDLYTAIWEDMQEVASIDGETYSEETAGSSDHYAAMGARMQAAMRCNLANRERAVSEGFGDLSNLELDKSGVSD